MGGHLDVATFLVDKGAFIDQANDKGWTALIRAAERGHAQIIEMLLDKHADINKRLPDGATALNIACEHGRFDSVVALVNSGADTEMADDEGYTPLITAAQLGFSDIVQFLVIRGAKYPRASAKWKHSTDYSGVVQAPGGGSGSSGADINICGGFQKWPALTVAYFSGYHEILQLIYQHTSPDEEVIEDGDNIIESKRVPVKQATFIPSQTIDQKRRNGGTALRIACEQGKLKLVEKLLQSTEVINLPNDKSLTPLVSAAVRGHTEILKLLLERGANPDIKGPSGYTALGVVCQSLVVDIHTAGRVAKVLIQYGASVNVQDENGDSPLLLAAGNGHLALVKLFLGKGASVNKNNSMN